VNLFKYIFYIIIKRDDDDIIDPPDFTEDEPEVLIESGEEEDILNIEENIKENIEDINVFNKNYNILMKQNKSSKVLSKYEKTKILSKRCEQLESGCTPLIKDYSKYDNIYDIALEEFNEKKIPFILKRFINGKYEYWKLKDLIY
jgi:DNA-directed RNA polymerase subunit K/omega